jgi:hypothetical protein
VRERPCRRTGRSSPYLLHAREGPFALSPYSPRNGVTLSHESVILCVAESFELRSLRAAERLHVVQALERASIGSGSVLNDIGTWRYSLALLRLAKVGTHTPTSALTPYGQGEETGGSAKTTRGSRRGIRGSLPDFLTGLSAGRGARCAPTSCEPKGERHADRFE